MAIYQVRAATSTGRTIIKDVEATSETDLARRLEKEGLRALSVTLKGGGGLGSFFKRKKSFKSRDMLIFNQGLVSLLKSGLPVIETLEALERGSSSDAFTEAIGHVIEDVRGGMMLSEALRARPEYFPYLYTASIAAGERTGDLVPTIKSYVEYQKRVEAVRKKLISALMYPVALAMLLGFVLIIFIGYVVPMFAEIYTDRMDTIPLASRVLITSSSFVKGNFLIIIAGIVTVVTSIFWYIKTESGRRILQNLFLRLPRVGEVYHAYLVSKFARTLAMVLASGTNLIKALEMSKGVLDNAGLEVRLQDVIEVAKKGGKVSEAMAANGIFPDVSQRMFDVGERSANLDEILLEIADFHDEEVDYKVGLAMELLEPALMVVMGLVIGTIVVLLYLPIFQSVSTL
ncbi:MAG: type II secretion system F family protein [Deltaproteobacteria bacterium]|nr:type II secretion system F family protein [Deltaproteobacteria bacterium]